MPRPCKCRRVCFRPNVRYFKPQAVSLSGLAEVALKIDEIEAVRLADLEGLYQEEAAEKMNISRQTFGNIIISAHRKIADFLVNAKALRIEEAGARAGKAGILCIDCGRKFPTVSRGTKPERCPVCSGRNIKEEQRPDQTAPNLPARKKRMNLKRGRL